MRLPFEEWVLQKKFSNNVTELFNESFVCYRNTAYRASLLFSYLSFITIVKEIIFNSTRPNHIPESRWESIIQRLRSDDTWEKTIYEELINNSSPVFNMGDSIRQQVKYWKDRRNDCAHFKSNEIESHHTESFWSFIKSNVSKITVEGGKESLLNKFEKHFDPTFTPPGADFTNLVKEIDGSVELNQLTGFWPELLHRIDLLGFYYPYETEATKVFRMVFQCCNQNTKENLAEFTKSDKSDLTLIAMYPELINGISYSPTEIREIWRNRIWQNKRMAFPVYSALLRNGLIPYAEINEANLFMIEKATESRPEDEPTHLSLAQNGFGESIFQVAFISKRLNPWFTWVNPRADMIAYYIEKYPLRDETVEIICEMYQRANYSFWLGERIEKIFGANEIKKHEFHSIATRRNFNIPEDLI